MIPEFRVFEKDRKIMCEVEELGFGENGDLQKVHYYWEEYGEYLSTSEIDDVILMQSTGFKDCEGKEIYEGDILIETKSKDAFEVKHGWFEDVGVSIFLQMGVYLYDGYETRPFYRLNYKVIGNIYEDPELLEVI